jgi:hypothetical protein
LGGGGLGMSEQLTIPELFKELEEDSRKLLSLIGKIKIDLITENNELASSKLEKSIFLAQKIQANLYSLYLTTKKEQNHLGDEI